MRREGMRIRRYVKIERVSRPDGRGFQGGQLQGVVMGCRKNRRRRLVKRIYRD